MHDNKFSLLVVIVNYEYGTKVLNEAKKCGILGGTIVPAKGTINSKLLNFLEITDIRKEVVLMATSECIANEAIILLNEKFNFEKKGHGIAFIVPLSGIFGVSKYDCKQSTNKEVEKTMYQAITTVVERGDAEIVIDAAKKAGARGGTIINARGSGIHETGKLFSIEIEPEKEVVLIISKADNTQNIVSSICNTLQIDKPAKGIMFVSDLSQAVGLY